MSNKCMSILYVIILRIPAENMQSHGLMFCKYEVT